MPGMLDQEYFDFAAPSIEYKRQMIALPLSMPWTACRHTGLHLDFIGREKEARAGFGGIR
jgi:hypothetical protein